MSGYFVYAIGFFAQALFGSRIIIQWIKSEKAKRVLSPVLFWKTSLFAASLFLVYGILRYDAVIIIGQSLSFIIYIRNLQLQQSWSGLSRMFRNVVFFMPIMAIVWLWNTDPAYWYKLSVQNDFSNSLVVLGTIGQLTLNVRFFYQWYYAEKVNESVLPLGFWVISIIGSCMVIIYSIYKVDYVLLLAQTMGFMAYTRNIMLLMKSPIKNYEEDFK